MRITAQARESTRRKILEKSHQLFCLVGFEVATTRDIAKAVGVAPGTLFNYFPSKEAIAAAIVMKQPVRARVDDDQYDTLEEALFAHAARTMRQWKACRNYIHAALEPTLAPLESADSHSSVLDLRSRHLEQVQRLSQVLWAAKTSRATGAASVLDAVFWCDRILGPRYLSQAGSDAGFAGRFDEHVCGLG